MKDNEIEIEEITLTPVSEYPNQWKQKLAESVNGKCVQTSFDKRVKITEKIDPWSINKGD